MCRLFDRSEVDGIHFQQAEFNSITDFIGNQIEFNEWKRNCLQFGVDPMIDEYIRLTNIAFKANCMVPPVFLLGNSRIVQTNQCSQRMKLFNIPSYPYF